MAYTSDLKIGRRIAHGHFGDVHVGSDPVHGKVAVKILRPLKGESAAEWQKRREELLNEAQRLKAAEHQNIVRVHNLVRDERNHQLNLVMEFCDGGSTLTLFEKGPVGLGKARKIATDLCLGLQAIHSRGFIHRDIKPGNILLAGGRYKVGDFGLVSDRVVHGYASAAGYLDHLAIEFHLKNVTSVKTDVWAVGMTLYRLLHGKAFYDHHFAALDIEASITNGGFATHLPWLPHVPVEWRKFIRKAMHDDSSLRIQNAMAAGQALSRLPAQPDWKCQFAADKTTWSRTKNGRHIYVELEVVSPRKHQWRAESRGGKRNITLGSSGGLVSGSAALAGLEAFFASQA